MAKAYQKPVIAPDMGCLSEEKDEDLVQLFKSEQEMVAKLRDQINTFLHG